MNNSNSLVSAVPASTIRIDYREHRSVPNAALQAVLRPFGPKIFRPGEAQSSGSPRLDPPSKIERRCDIREWQIVDTWIYTLAGKGSRHDDTVHRIFYFAGGGFRDTPSKEHWLLCAELADNLPEYEFNVVSYPLASDSPAPVSIPHMQRFYQAIAAESRAKGFRITLAGDSAGGNLALVLGLYAASEFLRQECDSPNELCPVESIFAMSPATDLRNLNSDIGPTDRQDPLLSRKTIEEVALEWKGDWDLSDPRISPTLANLTVFRRAGIKVDGLTGGHDVLTPDALLFRDKLAESGVKGDWLQWEKQVHCFPLMFSYHVAEAVAGKDWILETFRANSRHPSHTHFPSHEGFAK